MTVEKEIKEILLELLSVPEKEYFLNSKIKEDLNADSLDFIEIILEIEERFDIQLDENSEISIITVDDLINLVKSFLIKT